MRYEEQINKLKKHPIQFDRQTEMDRIKILDHLQYYDSFELVFTNDISIQFLEDIKSRIDSELENNVCIMIFGNKGSMKSGMALTLAEMFDPEFDASKQLVYSKQDLIDRMETSKPNQWFIMDEDTKDYGVGSRKINTDITMFVQTLRKRKNCLLFLSPTQQSIDALDYVVHTFKGNFDSVNKQVGFGIIDPLGSRRYIGGGRLFLNWNNQTWKDYSKMKDEFLEKAIRTDTQSYNVEKDALKLLEHPDFKICKNKKEFLLLTKEMFSHHTTGMQDDIVTKVSLMLRKQMQEQEPEE